MQYVSPRCAACGQPITDARDIQSRPGGPVDFRDPARYCRHHREAVESAGIRFSTNRGPREPVTVIRPDSDEGDAWEGYLPEPDPDNEPRSLLGALWRAVLRSLVDRR